MADFGDILGLMGAVPEQKAPKTRGSKRQRSGSGSGFVAKRKRTGRTLSDAQKAKMKAGRKAQAAAKRAMIDALVNGVGSRKASNAAARAIRDSAARHKAVKALYGGAALKHLNGYRATPTKRHLESDYPSALLAIQAYNSMHPIKSATGCAAASQANRVVRRAITRSRPRAAPTARQLANRARFAAASREAAAAGMSLAEYLRR